MANAFRVSEKLMQFFEATAKERLLAPFRIVLRLYRESVTVGEGTLETTKKYRPRYEISRFSLRQRDRDRTRFIFIPLPSCEKNKTPLAASLFIPEEERERCLLFEFWPNIRRGNNANVVDETIRVLSVINDISIVSFYVTTM